MWAVNKIPEMMTIDARQFTEEQFKVADLIFDEIKTQNLLPANEAYRDPVRKSLDKALLVDLLGLEVDVMESMDILRYKWCNEPSVHGGKSTNPASNNQVVVSVQSPNFYKSLTNSVS